MNRGGADIGRFKGDGALIVCGYAFGVGHGENYLTVYAKRSVKLLQYRIKKLSQFVEIELRDFNSTVNFNIRSYNFV